MRRKGRIISQCQLFFVYLRYMDKKVFEQWKPIVGYEGLYEVSNLGRVKSVERTRKGKCGSTCRIKEKILKPTKNSGGYFKVDLWKNNKRKACEVHRLVAEAFIPNPDPEKYGIINHKIEGDEGKLINTVENLEWCDYDYNNNYGTGNERRAKALTNRSDLSKIVYQYNTTHELVKEWSSAHEIERQMGWSSGNISACCNGKKKSAYKYIWSHTPLNEV